MLSTIRINSLTTIQAYSNRNNQMDLNEIQAICYTIIKLTLNVLEVMYNRPIITYSTNGITVTLGYYSPSPNRVVSTSILEAIRDQIQDQLEVNVTLKLVLFNTPFMDAQILACYISDQLLSHTFNELIHELVIVISPTDINTTIIAVPSNILGIKVSLAGRIETEPLSTRIVGQSMMLGTLSNSYKTINTIGSYTTINSLGCYTVKVWQCSRV